MSAALPRVLAAATTEGDAVWWRMMLTNSPTRFAPAGVEWQMATFIPWAPLRSWRYPTPAEALAALVEAEALPASWCDPARAPRWWCAGCGVCGNNPRTRTSDGFVVRDVCFACDDHGYDVDAPPSHAALVSVAALGPAALARAEAIVAETWPGRALAWRGMGRAALREHHETTARDGGGSGASRVFSLECERERCAVAFGAQPPWPAECPFAAWAMAPSEWSAVRALARREDGAPTGLHLVALDAARVVLAVETAGEAGA